MAGSTKGHACWRLSNDLPASYAVRQLYRAQTDIRKRLVKDQVVAAIDLLENTVDVISAYDLHRIIGEIRYVDLHPPPLSRLWEIEYG